MRKKKKNILAEAVARLKQDGLAQPLPQEVMDDTGRKIADCGLRIGDSSPNVVSIHHRRLGTRNLGWLAAAAVLVMASYVAGRLSAPSPDLEQLREALTPAVAASLEPALRRALGEDLTVTYAQLKEDLTNQYQQDLNRFAIQTLAASNAATNQLLAELAAAIGTAQARDQRQVAQALYQIEANRLQDRARLATGLQTLAYRTEDELSRTQSVVARLLTEEQGGGSTPQKRLPPDLQNERSEE
jgi:hypothetical protein